LNIKNGNDGKRNEKHGQFIGPENQLQLREVIIY
jgi:hypothetical protein